MPKNIYDKIKMMPAAKMIYPVITIIFALLVLLLFSRTLSFLSGNINKVFFVDNNILVNSITHFDSSNYDLIRRRFDWPPLHSAENSATNQDSAAPAAASAVPENTPAKTATSTAANKTGSPAVISAKTADTPAVQPAKAKISITIFNGSDSSDGASWLQDRLNAAGFSNTKIGAQQLSLEETVIQTKTASKNNQKLFAEIKQIVAEKYAPQTGIDLSESADYDVLILIGKK